MLTTAEATEAVRGAMPVFDAERVILYNATGRILRQTVVAERDQPPFDRVMMDGIALRYRDYASGARRFPIQATQAAGDPALTLRDDHCIEIMTGASLPECADLIVPVERIRIADGIAAIDSDYEPERRQFIHARGSDHAAGTELLLPGARITPLDIAVIASCGLSRVAVSEFPAITVISTGNELVPAGQPIEPHQVRLSNGPAIFSMLNAHGYQNYCHEHIVDEPDELGARIGHHLRRSKVLVLSGGVSMGKADFIPQVMHELGVEVVFHKVSQRPGKPMWFGIGPQQQAVFALPGNPVSALVCCRHYVIPALAAASAAAGPAPEFAALTQDVQFEPRLTCFLPVRIVSNAQGQQLAMPVHTNTSGDFAALSGTTGYLELPREESFFERGHVLPLRRWLP